MTERDQPTLFPESVTCAVSNAHDGTMTLRSLPDRPDEVWHNRALFIKAVGGDLARTALVHVTYDDGDDFCRYREVGPEDHDLAAGEPCDALVTREREVGLFLPVADCTAVTLFDPQTHTLMLSHIGRHSAEQYGGEKSVLHLVNNYNVNPEDLLVWMAPSVGAENYPVFKRGGRALKELITEDLKTAGVSEDHIVASPVNTATDENYFSHSEFLKGHRSDIDGRFAVFAMMNK